MKSKLLDYIDHDNFIYNLSGLTKLMCFICMTFLVMSSCNIRYILFVMVLSVIPFRMSEISFKQIKLMTIYVIIFLAMNFILTLIFSPQYGVEIHGTGREMFHIAGRYVVTQEQLPYQMTKVTRYASVVPLGMIFLLTTNPSEFATSINRVGCNYKATYALSLTLRYFPDMIRDYQDIALAQQGRGLDLSRKEKLRTRVRNVMNICVPLIFSTLDRIELISNVMDLRGFGRRKKRTWYVAKPLYKQDWMTMGFTLCMFLGSPFIILFVNQSRFSNPSA